MTGVHLGEGAELYALGMLEASERAAFDRHLVGCDDCTVLLGRAEAAVAGMVDATIDPVRLPLGSLAYGTPTPALTRATLRQARRPARTGWIAAAAATIAFAISTTVVRQNVQLHADVRADAGVLRALVDSHFSHVQFSSPAGLPLPAKVVYERHGRWFEILAHDIDPRASVIVIARRRQTPYRQAFATRADMLVLTLPALGRIDGLRLVDSRGRPIGDARLAYAK